MGVTVGEEGSVSWWVNTNRLLFVLVILFVLAVYYVVGGYGFPDYSNYIALVRNGGYLRSPDEYATEGVARFILKNEFGFFGSAHSTVDFLAAFVQLFYVVFVFILMKDEDLQRQRGWLFFTLALSPLLLTTVLRAGPAYLVVTYLALYGKVFTPRFIVLALIAISFHDSAIVMIALYVLSSMFCCVFSRVGVRELRWLMGVSLLIILLSQQVYLLLMSLVSNFELGIRSVYFQAENAASLVKKVFVVFIWFVAYTALYNDRSSIRTKVFLCACSLLMAVSFSINEVAGVRFSAYVLGVALVSKGAFILSGNGEGKFSRLDLLFGFVYFVVMFYDVFRNVKAG